VARLPGLHKRLSKAEEAELEVARERSIARLEQLLMQREGRDEDDGPAVDEAAASTPDDWLDDEPSGPEDASEDDATGDAPIEAADGATGELDRAGAAFSGGQGLGGDQTPMVVVAAPLGPAIARPTSAAAGRTPTRVAPAAAGRARATASSRTRAAGRRTKAPPVIAACPSCALLLDPPPAVSRRCVRCRGRIVVKRFPTGVLYLTESAAAAFEVDRRRIVEAARYARARERWLMLAAGVGVDPAVVERLASSPASAPSVAAARSLYVTAANRAFAAARRARRWADAAAIRRTQAAAVHRADDAPGELSAGALKLHRDAVQAELRGLREGARDATVTGPTCCDSCAADATLVARISDELKVPRLPHAGCPRGLCRCRWIAVRPVRPARKSSHGPSGRSSG
jgi:hypothetical protein